jgi:hypothetical protein
MSLACRGCRGIQALDVNQLAGPGRAGDTSHRQDQETAAMPLHAQIICIGGNGLIALAFGLMGLVAWGTEQAVGLFLLAIAGIAGYSAWVTIKFRGYLAREAARNREQAPEQRPPLN